LHSVYACQDASRKLLLQCELGATHFRQSNYTAVTWFCAHVKRSVRTASGSWNLSRSSVSYQRHCERPRTHWDVQCEAENVPRQKCIFSETA